jgi:uncharacterized protein
MPTRLPLYAGGSPFDPSRVRVLPRRDKVLVMDRVSGRWVILPEEERGLVELLGAPPAKLPDPLRGVVDEVRRNLVAQEVGVAGPKKDFSALTTVIIKLTNACNLACAYCYDFETTEKAQRVEAGLAMRALEQAIDLCKGKLWVIFHGGEPMLVWSLIEALVLRAEAYAAPRGVALDFTGQTNMTRVNDAIVEFSTRHRIAWGISVDGTRAVHDRFRVLHDGRGTHELFLQALERYPAFVRNCGVMSTITSANHDRLLDAARYFRDLGMSAWDWSLFQPIGRARDEVQFDIDTDKLVASYNELFDAVLAGEFRGFPVLPVKKYVDNFLHGPGRNMCMRPDCGAARDLLSISSDGTIEACDCIDPLGPLGNLGDLRTGSLAAARASDKAMHIRSRDVQEQECGRCIWFGVCGGTCLAHAGGIGAVWAEGCAVALNAFDRISDALAAGPALQSYLESLPA